jgi:hypothetical protein
MKKLRTLTAIAAFMAAASQAATITYSLVDDWDSVLDSATETYTKNVTGFNGTNASFDLIITAEASGGNWFAGTAGVGITGGANDKIDVAGENGTFTVAVANFIAGTSGYDVNNVDFGFVRQDLASADGATNSGSFVSLNGASPSSSLIWVDENDGISSFTGDENGYTDLQLMNDTYGTGDRLTSFTENLVSGPWRYNSLQVEYDFAVVPEPGTYALLGGLLALSSVMLRRRRR